MQNTRLKLVAVILFCFVGAAAYVLATEASVFLNQGTTASARFVSKVNGNVSAGFSTYSQNISLRDCDDSLKSQYSRTQARNLRSEAMRNCLTFALAVTDASPANGLAWFIAAQSSAWLRDYPSMNDYLEQSRAVNPNYATLNAGRMYLMTSVHDHLNEATRKILVSDINSLANSEYGRTKVAELYLRKPNFRPLLTSVIESWPSLEQRKFLSLIRKQSS